MSYRQIRNFDELTSTLNDCLDEAFDKAKEIAINKLIEFIKDDVYSRPKSKWYKRTEDLLDERMWDVRVDHRYNMITLNIHFKDDALSYNPNGLQHGTQNKQISAQDFISVLNDPSLMNFECNLSNWTNGYPRHGFWDDFEEWMRNNFIDIIKAEMNGEGIKIN